MKPKNEQKQLKPTPFADEDISDIIKEVHERTESPASVRSPSTRSDPHTHAHHRHTPSYTAPQEQEYKPKKTRYYKN
jgi:hypothetical protein